MKRDFPPVVRLVLPVLFTCVVLAIAIKVFDAPSSTPAWAALHASPASPYHNVIVVARSGGDFTSVQKALNSITDNSPTNRYLVWVAPGTYTETVRMKEYVDIEGAGEMVTRIVGAGSDATLFGASNAELRYLTVESTNSLLSTAIWNAGASPRLLHVTAISSPPTGDASTGTRNPPGSSPAIWQNYGIHNTGGSAPLMTDVTVSTTVGLNAIGYGIYNDSSSPTLTGVTISISGSNIVNYGIYNNNSSSTMKDVTISASGGTGNYGLSNNGSGQFGVTIDDSTISATGSTINSGPSYATRVGASKLEGGPVYGTVTCAGVYDENYTFYPNTCP